MPSRRDFIRASTVAGLWSCFGDLPEFWNPVSAAETEVSADLVRLHPAIEPIVQLIEKTPRDQCFEMMVEQLRKGLPYRQFLAALFLAGIRNVNPQPPGFKFHCVFVIHAVNQLSLDAPVGERLLPLFWALDYFKVAQQEDINLGDFRLGPVSGNLPSPTQAWDEFHAGMEAWDAERADRAIVSLVRSRGSQEVIEGLWRYGARDFRNIGHKAIFVANSWRTLQTIGWQHAEPTLRSLVLGLLDFGKDKRVNEYAYEDQSYVSNVQRTREFLPKLPGDWTQAVAQPSATVEILNVIRSGDMQQACQTTVERFASGSASAQAVWDAVHLAAGELMMQQQGIFGIHTVTSVNALHSAFGTASQPDNRLMLALQGVGWMCQFHNFMAKASHGLKPIKITDLAADTSPVAQSDADSRQAIEKIMALVSADAPAAALSALGYAKSHPEPVHYMQAARQLIFRKATDAHDFKYAAAIFEDYERVSPEWRPQMLATSVYHLSGSTLADSPVMTRAKDAVKAIA